MNNQEAINQLFGQFKFKVMMLLNDTADEFDKLDLNDEQRKTYNDFTGSFGKKVLEINAVVEGET